ncbi:MAG: glyoxalase [Thermoleophilaceae bacterium]|nr:glyoxalase [Thermoleophilaceae bacterium]
MRPRVSGIQVADAPAAWAALGFEVEHATVWIDGVAIRLGGEGRGITGWTLGPWPDPAPQPAGVHPNGVEAIDHIVLVTGGWDATVEALAAEGIELSREARRGDLRQGFVRLGAVVLEVVHREDHEGPAGFWGLTFVADLDSLGAQLGDRLGTVRDAVQPDRRIATLSSAAGLSHAIAFMTPEPGI